MNVSIVSLFGTFNYGNRLQSYAVQEVLHKLGCQTKVIYIESRKTSIREIGKKFYFSSPLKSIMRTEPQTIKKYQRQKTFEQFNKNYITTKKYTSIREIEDNDFYVLGSDQVWNPKRYNDVKKALFFLTFAEPEKKVCLAPSFGLSKLPEGWEEYYREQLSTFPMLSVREFAGAKIIKELTGKDAEVLIDPTLMLNSEEWLKIAKKPIGVNTDVNYILSYFLGNTPSRAINDGIKIAQQLNGKIYDLMDPDITGLFTSGPSEFIHLFNKASFILTDSYHASIFSFIFKKPFLLYPREGKDADMFSRIETLFKTLDLMRKFVGSGVENDLFECDYQSGYENLRLEKRKVVKFLKNSMNIIN